MAAMAYFEHRDVQLHLVPFVARARRQCAAIDNVLKSVHRRSAP